MHASPRLLSLAGCSLLSVGLLVGRFVHTHHATFAFLIWNLALAWIPYACSARLGRGDPGRVKTAALAALWLLFFPNAPYLVTDFLHLRARPMVPLWYDVALIAAFAITGMLLAVVSLHDVRREVARRRGDRAGWITVVAVSFVSGLGIYVGRFLRWNSWDLLLRPDEVVADVLSRVVAPHRHPGSWGVTLVFGALLLATYVAFEARASTDRRATAGTSPGPPAPRRPDRS